MNFFYQYHVTNFSISINIKEIALASYIGFLKHETYYKFNMNHESCQIVYNFK